MTGRRGDILRQKIRAIPTGGTGGSSTSERSFRRRGFTLAELMVSVGVLMLLLTMVGMIFKMATDASGKATANNTVMARLRTLEHQLRQDFLGLKQDAFIGLWYQVVDSGWDAPNGQNILVRSDRIVFFGAGDQEAKTTPVPLRTSVARIFYGHYDRMYPNAPNRPLAQDWILGRRTKLLVSDPNLVKPIYVNQVDYDSWDYEFGILEDWRSAPMPPDAFVGPNGVMVDGTVPNSASGLINWVHRPMIDVATSVGRHMRLVSDCAEFKIQRWITRHPVDGSPLPAPRWYPDEPGYGDFTVHASDPRVGGTGFDIMEYFNGPKPSNFVSPPPMLWSDAEVYGGTNGPWIYHSDLESPKVFKVTVRLFDENERIEGGQQFTMVFEIPGVKGMY